MTTNIDDGNLCGVQSAHMHQCNVIQPMSKPRVIRVEGRLNLL
jgi:hypothetical protein